MGIKINGAKAKSRMLEALAIARSGDPLPDEWLERTREIAKASSKTFTPMLGTALLAKATDDRAAALALKESAGHNAYSARGICHSVLVPMCVAEGINIRTTGKEPLNNQPFFRYDLVSTTMRVRASKEEIGYLVKSLERADFLRGDEALLALAAFLRARIADPASAAASLRKVASNGNVWPLDSVASFVRDRTDGGRRAQACVAAGLDLIHAQVRTGRINDPSRDFPGDVHVTSGVPTLAVEVRQKVVTDEDVEQFAGRCASKGIRRVAVAAFATGQTTLDDAALGTKAQEQHGALLEVWYEPAAFLRSCAMQCAEPPEASWPRFAERMLRRLEELEAPNETISSWVELVEAGAE